MHQGWMELDIPQKLREMRRSRKEVNHGNSDAYQGNAGEVPGLLCGEQA
jgi:hypothetical protein